MRVVALGGAGGMGRHAVRTATSFDFVEEVVVADLDGDAAARFAEHCGPKARGAVLNVWDTDAVTRLLEPADVVLNTVGPFYRFGVRVLRAAISAGCHYLDINDDWEPTLAMLALDDEASTADVTAIVGLGASPGVSNLLAVKAMAELDSVDELVTGWGLAGGGDGERGGEQPDRPSAALVHWMHQCSGTIRILRDGRMVDVPPVEKVSVDYPGVGVAPAWTVGHPEAVTLPRGRPDLRHCVNVMVMPEWLIDVVRALARDVDAGKLSAAEAAARLTEPAPRSLRSRAERGEKSPALPPLFALARGSRNGRPTSVGASVLGAPGGGMGGITGIPLALGLAFFADGSIGRRGVLAPEDAIDPDRFFDALAPLCSPPLDSGEKLVLITRSGDSS